MRSSATLSLDTVSVLTTGAAPDASNTVISIGSTATWAETWLGAATATTDAISP